jgi:2-amino-4-hydroxy-6-hydroxymethyldihydropteridine diphosphokinase
MSLHNAPVTAYVGLGANLGDAEATVRKAIAGLNEIDGTKLTAQSSLYRSAPIDADGGDYVNAVAQVHTTLRPHELLHALQGIEQQYGRARPYVNAPRTLDLDLLLYGREHLDSPELTVPHPRMTARAFVLIPLLQIDPFIDIPGKGVAHRFAPAVADQAIRKIG